ncbi:hemagglutinin repeat-containing protein [Fusobacterium polymorphum]|uniref:two-partner secretion domain-containing protein n=2 Tax=Fusobacterium TaxID=848 RepID=UPI0022E5985C|nr:hemagglutinin repeat-containing protein [Fusobacterium polymorphum]
MRNKFFKKFITVIFLLIYNIEIFAANLVVDPNSNYNTKLDESASGVPIVNISTPNDRGVSINEFSEYNIDEKGQILNNADNIGRSYLGGIINANPNLAPNQAANLIILQVNGSNRSQIEGYLEALSRERVDVILSNENGLYINNSGTINIKNFTATTGKVNLKDGDFIGIDVEKGNIVIGPNGIDGTNANYVEIIAKALELRGNIVANDLKVVTGSNSTTTPTNNIAIDAKELGGMYANRIRIISTDKGAGVNSDAFIVSKDSKLEITADGKIKVNKVQGKGIDIKGKEYEQKDLAYSDEGISINADKIKLSGTGTQANKQIDLNGTVENNATIYTKEGIKTKDLTNSGIVQAIKKIEVEGNLTNKGEVLTNGNLTAKDSVSTKKIIAKDGISVGKLENSGMIVTDKKLDIKGNLTNSGEIQTLDNITVKDNISNTGDILTNGTLTSKDVKNEKVISVNKDINIAKLENNGNLTTANNLNINGSLINSGNIQAIENISVINNVLNKGTILTNGSFTSKDIKNEKELSANKDITVSKLENTGNILTNSKIDINGSLTNKGEIQSLSNIAVAENTTNTGSILTNKNFTTKDLINNNKLIAKEKIDTKNLKNTGTIASGDKFTVTGNLENTNNIETTNLDVTGNKLTNSGSIKADNITTNVANITNDGKILSFNNISFSNAQNIKNTDEIKALKEIKANNINLVNSGEIASNEKVFLNNSSITNTKTIASSTIEMQNNKKFDNSGEIAGNNVTLITTNDIDLVGKLHGAQSLTISGKNITNNGETTGTGTTTITANNFTNNKNLSAQTLTVTATGDVVNNKELNGGKVSITGNNIQNNDLIAAAGDLTLTATNKVDNKSGKTIFAGGKLSITGKEILNNKDSELLGSNIELIADRVKNEVGTIKAFNDITIKTDKFENIGEVKDLDKYEKYYETWDGKILSESEIGDWKRKYSESSSKTSGHHSGRAIREDQKNAFERINKNVENDKYKSLLFPKYKKLMEGYLGNEGEYTEKTGTAKIQDIPLKEKVKSLGETERGKVLAGRNITIEGKNGGNANEVLNKDSIISAGNTVTINTNKLENIVSIGEKVQVKTGQESMFVKYQREKRKRRRDKLRMEVTYTRDLIDLNQFAYVTGSPSIIEGKNVVINPLSIVKQQIDEANGEINQNKINKVEKPERDVHKGIEKDIKEEKIAPNQINVKDELKKYGNVGTEGVIYNGNNGQLAGSTKVIDEIIKNGKIDIDASLSSALFIKNISSDSKYVMETRLKYIDQSSFYGSDYFLKRIGYEEKWNRVKRLGDAYYENELIERSITEKLGTRFLNGKEISAKDLMDNAVSVAKENGLTVGQPLTKEQIAKLDRDIVWYEYQNVDGIQVLAPKVYLSQNTLKNLNTDTRSRITGLENTYVRTGNLENTGLIGGYGNTYVEAKEINNKTLGNQLAEIRGDKTTIIAQNNINNIGARISGNKSLNLVAIDGDIVNKSTVEKIEFNNGEFDRSKFTKIDSIGEIVSNGNLNILTNNYTSIGAITQAKNVNINVTNNINIKSQEVSGEQKFGKGDSQYNYYGFERNIGSVVKAENLNTTASDLNISGSAITTKTANLNVDKLNIESKVDKEDEIKKSSYKSLLKSGSKKETIHNEENSAGSLYVENKGTIKGDVNLVGSNLVLGNDSFVGGKVTTDSRELHSSYSLEEKKKGFSGSIGSGGFSVGYGKSESKLKEKDLTNSKSNLVLGDGTTLNKGADITATNLIHGNISINNGDVKFGARKDVKDIETSSKSSGINLSVKIKSEALDRAKQGVDSFKQMQSGDILGGIASSTNTVTGLVQGLSSNITKKDGSKATLKDIKDGDFKVNNNFYANAGVNLGFNKSSSNSKSHNEFGVVTTIRGKDENSSITYNNVKNIEYVGTQAQNTKFIYNNVENITKKAVELNNYSSSSSKSSGVSAGVTINYNNGFQAEADAIRVSASKSKMDTNGTTYQNGRFVDVDEVHNNTKNMTLSGFNQEGGIVTGNIQNLTIESKQNTSTTTGSTKGGSIGFAPNGMPNSISANYSQTNGERKVVDSPTTFLIGDGSNLKVGKVENTAGAIGATGSGKLSIDEYIGHNLENKDEITTKGGSLSLSPSSTPVSGVGINYANRDLESVTKNTVVGNVEIGKSSGDEINKDLASMTEITKDKDTKTNVFIESQTIKYALNPSQFKEDLQIAIIEGKATGRTVVKTIDNMINGDKSQDIGDAEKRSLIEIKEAIVRVQTAPAMDIIAKEDLADKNVQAKLKVEIEKFDSNDPTLSEKVRERINELKAEGKEIVAFYDKKTGKIFINQNAKDDEVRASIAREYKIKEDLELGRGKENDKGQLRSTVAGEIAYDEIKDRLKKGDKNPISASSFDIAKMDKNSEVTADGYFEEGKAGLKKARAASKYTKLYEELEESEKSPEEIKRILAKGNKDLKLEFGEIDKELQKELDEEKDAGKRALLVKKKIENSTDPYEQEYYKAYYNHLIRKNNPKEAFFNSAGKGAVEAVETMLIFRMFGIIPKSAPNITIPKSSKFYKDTRYPISAEDLYVISVNDPEYYKDNSHLYKVTGESNVKAGLYNKKIEDPVILKHMTEYHNNTLTSNEKLGYSVGNLGTYVVGNKILNRLDGYIYKNPNSSLVSANKITNEEQLLLENKVNPIQNKVFINDGTPGGTTVANQIRVTDSSGNMLMLQNNLTTGELSFQGISSSGQRIFEKSLTPYPANALIGTSSSSQMLVGDGAVNQVASKLPYKSVLALPVKYPIKSESGVTLRGANDTKKIVSSTDTPIPKIEVETPNIKDNSFNKLKPINLDKLKVVENSTPEEANLYWRENAGYTNKPYDENYEVKLVKNNGEKFVRVYTPSMGTRKASAWFMREKDIIGLTPEEIKDKYALPYTPTHVVDVKIGSVTIRTGVVKEVEGWGKGKGQQFDTNGTRLSEKQFINEREIGEKYEKK